ncbi:MAG TPA: Gldg family protein [Acidimicrobiia bacterium]|nr:Gldg family protein [Acidimicrobiia bacterium]
MNALFVFRRELRGLLRLPQTYGVSAAYLLISGIFFVNILISTEVADLASYYSNIANTLLVLVPVVAMRSFAEERRSGALDISLAWPTSRTGLVLGKFAANTLFVWVLASVVWLYFSLVGSMASIEGSRTGGGYVGLLLMSMAFSALALMVSARAASTTAAAFLGFGLLLFLWILEYAPGWIGDGLRSLGPAAHFEAFPRGILYGDDIAYFLAVTALGLGLTVSALNRERPGRTSRSLVQRGAVLGVVLGLGAGGTALASGVEAKVDLTPDARNTLTDATRKVLGEVRAPIRLTGFAQPFSREEAEFRSLVKLYRAAGADITMRQLDPDVHPAGARSAGITLYGEVLVEIGDRREVIDGPTEGALTSAIHRVGTTSSRRACFTVGHGERSITDESRFGLSSVASQLRSRLFYDVQPVALGVPGAAAELARCTLVVVAGPQVPFLPAELTLLERYGSENGRLLVLVDGTRGPREQLNELLAPLGVAYGPGVVSDLSALADDPGSVVSSAYPSSSPATLRLREQELPVVFVNSAPVAEVGGDADGDGHVSPLVLSSDKSWLAAAPGGPRSTPDEGPFALAALVDRSRLAGGAGDAPAIDRTRVGVVGSVEVAANRGIELLGNGDFVFALVQWVARDDDVVAAVRPSSGLYKLVLTEGQRNRLIRQGIAFPSLLVLLPLPLALLRLRRG